MCQTIHFTPITRPLRAISYSAKWIGTESALEISSEIDLIRARVSTVRILYRTALFLSDPLTVIERKCRSWITVADTIHVLTSRLKNINHYYSVSQTQPYKVLITIGALAKIGSSTYKIFFWEISGWKKASHGIMVIRKITFLYSSLTGKKSPKLHLTLLTISLILEVVIDSQQKPK